MIKRKIIIILIFISVQIHSQENRVVVHGFITSDSTVVENVNIINKNTSKGVVSDKQGKFKIAVKENDVLQFSDVQYKTIKIIIKKSHLQSRNIEVVLSEKRNELREVVLENMAIGLGLPNAGKTPLNKLERNLNAYSQKKLPIVILETLMGKYGGIDDIYNIVSGNRKKDRKLKSLIEQDKLDEDNQIYVQKIRNHFKDDFFIKTLHLEKNKINEFINYCLSKNIIFLYNKKRYLDIVNIFMEEVKTFKTE